MNQSCLKEIINIIAYFDVFNYPLSIDELTQLVSVDSSLVNDCIKDLNQLGIIAKYGAFIGTEDLKSKVEKRCAGNNKAETLQDKAAHNAKLISKFPFVRGVLISGSFSKGFVGENGDIDYFIITKPGRLWIARTFLILYKKVFLFNSHEYFCVNYFVDEDHLEIEEKNIFTATELITLLPMVNHSLHQKLIESNIWVNDYYPALFHNNKTVINPKTSLFKRVGEKVMQGKLGSKMDHYFMSLTLKRWQKKFGFLSDDDFKVAMKTTTNVSKHHPNNFQRKVLDKHLEIYQSLINKLEEKSHVKTAI